MTSRDSALSHEMIVSYPLCLASISKEAALSKVELIEVIIWGFKFLRRFDGYSAIGNFIDLVEYYLQHEKESEMTCSEEATEWYNFLEWLETEHVYNHLLHWARHYRFTELKRNSELYITPFNSHAFKIRIS